MIDTVIGWLNEDKFSVGDKVRILHPGSWEWEGEITEVLKDGYFKVKVTSKLPNIYN